MRLRPTPCSWTGRLLAQAGRLSLYRVDPTLRLASLLGGLYGDGWMASDAALTHYAKPDGPGSLRVRVSRASWRGPSPPAAVTVKVGPLGAANGAPTIRRVTASSVATIRSGATRRFTLPAPGVPYRLEIHVGSTFSPSDYGSPDTRQLGAQVDVEAS